MKPRAMTAAHRNLPFGTHVRVVNKRNGKSVTVRINDRGLFVRGRVIDLTASSSQRVGHFESGTRHYRAVTEMNRSTARLSRNYLIPACIGGRQPFAAATPHQKETPSTSRHSDLNRE
jgi:rare lipoprotein A